MARPVIKITKDRTDKTIEFFTFLAVGVAFVFPLIYFINLPEQIPIHFDGSGNPDRFAAKSTVWALPVVGLLICFGIFKLTKYPQVFNYPQTIRPENAKSIYRTAQKMLRMVNFVIAASLAYITIQTVLTAMGRANGLGSFFLPVFTIALFVIPVLYLVQMNNSGAKK